MNNIDKQYQALLQDILDNGVEKKDRTGTGTISVFGRQIRHKMSEGFPLLTTKKLHWKSIVTELLWFLNGRTDLKWLLEQGNNIWVGDAYKNYRNKSSMSNDLDCLVKQEEGSFLKEMRLYTQEEFINKIKTDDKFAKKWGELGPIYGRQWRRWGESYGVMDFNTGERTYIDQIANLINDLKTNPDSRRLIVSAWNVGELDQMVLPPCHYGFQVYTRELSEKERITLAGYDYENRGGIGWNMIKEEVDLDISIPRRAISLMWNQRSVDTFLGLPFNIASYGLLLEIIAKAVNMVPDELIGNLGDVHLYSNHIEQAKEQIGRRYTPEERELMLKDAMSWRLYNKAVNELMPFGGGMSEYYESHKIPYFTREPYPLPTLKHMKTDDFYKSLSENVSLISHLDIIDFELENYQSHPAIKAPLSN